MKKLLSLLSVFTLLCGQLSAQLLIDFDGDGTGAGQDNVGAPHTEPGYQSYPAAHEVPSTFGTETYAVNFNLTGSANVSLTPAWPNTTDARVQQLIDRTADFDMNWVGNNLDLLTDWIGSDSRTGNGGNGDYDGVNGTPTYMTLTLGGVPAGVYDWTSFHHDTEHMNSLFTVELSTDGGANYTMIGQYQMTDSTPGGNPDSGNPISGATDPDPHNLPSTVNFQFATTGDDVVVRFTPLAQVAVHQQFFGINGFELVQAGSPQVTRKILLVSDNAYAQSRAGSPDDPEVEMQAFLESLGYEVVRNSGMGGSAQFRDANEGAAGAIAAAQNVDLVYISRVSNSGDYDGDIAGWNSIDKPVVLAAPHISRDNRWRWFATSTIVDDDLTDFVFVQPNHPFVQGLGTDFYDAPTPMTRIGTPDAGNGTAIATDPAGNLALVEWETGVEFYPGSGQIAGGPRVYLGGHRYHEDTPGGVPIEFEAISENGKAIIAQILATLLPAAGSGYQEPSGGWTYIFNGDTADAGSGGFTALDGTWSHDNGSDEWDGSSIGAGSPGGVSQLEDSGFDFVRIQDPGDPRNDGFPDPGSNRKVYLGHSVDGDGVTGPILQDGFTLSFRARIATGDPLDAQTGGAAWPAEGKGYLGHDGGKGNVTVRQSGVGTISFSLTLGSESLTGESGLSMNGLNGSAASANVDPFQNEGTANVFPVEGLNEDWHEFWINIVEDTTGGGTHRVDVYADGSETETSYHVTAGTGSDFDGNYIAFGAGATPQFGAWDLDFIAYKEGIHLPRRQGTGAPVSFEEQPQSLTVLEGRPASFSVSILGTPPRELQWQRSDDGGANFTDIPGADGTSYDIARVENSDNGAIFRVVGTNPIGTTLSAEATLTVIDDNEAPQIVSVVPSANFRSVTINMNEPLDLSIANDTLLYLVLNPVTQIPFGNQGLAFSDDGSSIILTLDGAMEPDTVYTAFVFFGADIVGNVISEPRSLDFRSLAFSPGFALREFYFLPAGAPNTVEELRNAPNFPDNPDMVDYSPFLEGPVNAFDNYGLRISGRLIPKTTGLYDFFMSSDDAGEFWLNLIPDDNQPANLTLIAQEPVWNGSRDWIGTARRDPVNPENRSTTLFPDGIMLQAGSSYYFEALMKEGTGGDNLAVTAVPHGELPQNGSTPITGTFTMAAPIRTDGASVTITQQPQDALVTAGCILDGGTSPPGSVTAFPPPAGGWDYLYDGAGIQGQGVCHRGGADPIPTLDGTWLANNGSTEWDGSLRGAGNGAPGGISSDGDILTIEDINMGSGNCNNRKIYFTHDLSQEIAALPENLLDTGVTLTFRTRLTQPDIDPAAEITTPDGWGIFSGGKGQFSVRQSNPSSIISFSLVRESEPDNGFNFTGAGLTMNRLNGDAPANNEVNTSTSAADNQVLALDPNEFHEFWVTIQANDGTPGNGTHTVNIYVDGSSEPTTFNVTAGTGSDASGSYVAMGLNNSTGQGAVDIDFFGVKAGALPPPQTGLFVDFDNGGNQDGGFHTEEGYQSYVANHEVAADFSTQMFDANFAVTGPATVSVTPTWPNTTDNRVQQMIDRGAGNDVLWLGDKINLLTDWLGTDTRTGSGGNGDFDGNSGTPTYLDLTVGGLPAGNYRWLSFHHDTEHMHTPFTVDLSTDGGASFARVGQFQMTDTTPGGTPDSGNPIDGSLDPDPRNLPSTVVLDFTATGSDVVLRFTPLSQVAVHQQFFGINGFELNQVSATAVKPKILLVSDNVYSNSRAGTGDPEVEFQSFLEGLGYEVIRASGEGGSAQFTESQEGAAGAAAVGADLIIVSGVANSGNYDADIASWNNIETPLLLLSPHISRDSRWRWFGTSTIIDLAGTELQELVFAQPNHPFVDGLDTDIYDSPGQFTRIGTSSAGNGTVIATDAAGNVTLAEWAAGVEFYPGSGQFAGGRRVAFGRHRYHEDDPNGMPIQWELYSENGKALLAQIINELAPVTGGPGPSDPAIPVEFTVAADGMVSGGGDPVFLVQWQKNGVDIPGANDFTLSTTVTQADAGAEFRALIFVPGAMITSETATLIFNEAPEIVITAPEDGAVLAAGSPVTLLAEATDADGSVAGVEFFAEGVGSLGPAAAGPDGWSLTIADPAPGIYVLTAIATDDLGATCASLPIMVEVLDNTPPIANDDSATTDEDTAVTLDVLANDVDADGDVLTVVSAAGAANGSVSLNPDGTVTYTPAPNFNGSDSFTYVANDGAADSNPATVTVTVNPVNDPPTCAPSSGAGNEDETIAITLMGSDVDGDALTFTATHGANGTVSVSGNVATYTGNLNFCGTDSFSFTVTDPSGTSATCDASVTVNGVNDAPTAVVTVSPQADLGDTVSGLVVISADGEMACLTLDASETFDVDADNGCGEVGSIEGYTWVDAAGNVLGTGPVVEVCLPVGRQEITLLVDDGDTVGETIVIVEILTPSEAIEELIMQVEESVIERGNKQPFLATLKTAAAGFDRGSYGSALNRLENAFQNKVRAQVSKDNPDVAEEWIRIAQVIIDAIGDYRP